MNNQSSNLEPIIILLLLFLVVLPMFFVLRFTEDIFPLNPLIDTVLPEEFSEDKFYSIRVGMSKEEVFKLLGKPNGVYGNEWEDEDWYYGHDGGCKWWDFAWFEYEIIFDKHDRVIKTERYAIAS